MVIRKKRINKLAPNVRGVRRGQAITMALLQPEDHREALTECGFGDALETGETVLPSARGPTSTFNAEGKEDVHKDQEMETHYRQVEWTWTEYHGRDNPVEQTEVRERSYQRYPRTFVEPPAIELTVATSAEGSKIVISPRFEYVPESDEIIRHTINLFLELFGECAILDSELNEPIRGQIRRLNWEILPRGRMPWQQLRERLRPVIEKIPGGNQPVIERRAGAINAHGPEFTAIGRAGFQGYVIFGFPDRNLYVLESTEINNATYTFRDNWEHLSTLTKAEILREGLQEHRIIHRRNWFDEMDRILRQG